MKCKKLGSIYFVRIDKNEEILSELKKVCSQYNIKLGKISGIGAVDRATIGFFEPAVKKYHKTELTGDHEITTLTGNITTMNDEIYLHVHINLANCENKTFGGHLNEAFVSATCEIIIVEFTGEVGRFFNESSGLNLLDV
ncbi:PPC domain-containing DNA-binding protein [Candidatus Cloacimonadota bacterium]